MMMFDKYNNEDVGTFYELNSDLLNKAENNLDIQFPASLVSFYNSVGYGFFNSTLGNINRLMDPSSVAEFRTRSGQFAEREDLDIYEDSEGDKLVFFEANEYTFVSIAFTGNDLGKVFFMNKKIADSLEEFLERFVADEQFFIK
ncbi:SMI1/KNR4 family protein [Weissella confusa]|jgi:hypothetical protein|uniref:SMI1/KNR4 family protein n=1 Tax=Weissella confusa TaxID=1583 RepID=UPI001DA0EF68|nr:SMI1/KNR4 family protein [Weissella confusa]MBJ7625164.1 hypothetical protein [Weissella confusa]MBJ7658009.1 hypothetical protein [Weissella confusa]MBJ7665985.1 hypothetical protein [Weissella confusa]MBJ7676559.1 hypothetical protein [Weissella confusa]WEY47680.1 SMI1/KNR4 family protein [Weissella confusa]